MPTFTELEFTLEDVVGGEPVTPLTVNVPTLRGFLEDVEAILKGKEPGVTLERSRVRIEPGSLKLVALVLPILAQEVTSDLALLERTGDLDAMHPRRAQVIEQWLKKARNSKRTYCVFSSALPKPLRISENTQFQHKGENAWVRVEKYLTGRIVDLGGKHDPNVHLVLEGTEESLCISATENQLAAERENQLYRVVTLRTLAEQNLHTKALRSLSLIGFLPQSSAIDEEKLHNLWEKGHEAWKDVVSGTAWVEDIRGH